MRNENRIRIGNQTAFMAASPLEPFFYAVENGFDAFEWFPDKKENGAGWEITDIPEQKRHDIRETASSHDIRLTVHSPWWVSPLRPEAATVFKEQILFAGQIGASLVNLHLSLEAGLEDYASALLPAIQATKAAGLRLAVENTPLTPPEAFNRLFSWWGERRDISIDHVGMCLDLGHANLCDATRNDYVRYLDQLGPQVPIIHMHLHENYGDRDSHLPIFTGPAGQNDAGMRAVLERLIKRGFSGAIILEQWPEPHSLLRDGRTRLLDILKGYQLPTNKKRQPMAESARKRRPPEVKKETPEKPAQKPTAHRKPSKTPNRASRPRKKQVEGRFFDALLKMDRTRRSWREKLDGVLALLAEEALAPTGDDLIYLAIYLRFLGTGEVSTSEDGRHFRPSHHARMAQRIIERLTAITTPEIGFIVRKLYPWLPSYESQFMRAEPLTRIRDIAHRNDIPQKLKKEIKHTLQNKLHRCAGPEDLETSAALLERITSGKARYSEAFVEQFRIFHAELQDFFNAGPLESRLQKFLDDQFLAGPVKRFLQAKKDPSQQPDRQLTVLTLATELRGLLLKKAGKETDALAQNMRLADIGLEDYQFVLLSEWITGAENSKEIPWQPSFRVLQLTLENIGLSGILPGESAALSSNLNALAAGFAIDDREQLLRLKAALAGCLRLTETYSDLILRLFLEKVEHLGHELGIDEHAVKLYCEGDIRGNLVFQLSRLASLLTRKIRQLAALSPWDVIVAGTAEGRLITTKTLHAITPEAKEELLAMLDQAEGDETVPAGVAGIILAHGLPHLSHLAIRTRQEGVVLIAGEDKAALNELKKQKGKALILTAGADGVTFTPSSGKSIQSRKKKPPLAIPRVELIARQPVLELEQVSLSNGGAKAYGVQLLRTLARKAEADFITPRGVALPFGVMEAAFAGSTRTRDRYDQLVKNLTESAEGDLEATADKLAELVGNLAVSPEVVQGVSESFPDEVRLMVRSSANSEDLESMAGAGLYESVANVRPELLAEAIRRVWASLWSRRAARSRRQAGIPQDAVHMAVLIQELIDPDYSFVMHTANPISGDKEEVYIEMAVGLGEILASAAVPGTPYRLTVNKKSGAVRLLSFADFGNALRPGGEGGINPAIIDYSKIPFTTDAEVRRKLAGRLAAIARFVEAFYGQPQDIEGAVAGENIVLLQSRAQQG